MNLFDGHDKYVQKNAMMAKGYDLSRKDKKLEEKGVSLLGQKKDASCFTCKTRGKCKIFESKRTGGNTGAVSFGGDEKFFCDKYEPMKSNVASMSSKEVKSLLKNAMKGRI
jgi:hypothetical protein